MKCAAEEPGARSRESCKCENSGRAFGKQPAAKQVTVRNSCLTKGSDLYDNI